LVATKPATSIGSEIVTLNASVDDDQTAQYWFAYGTGKTALTEMTSKYSAPAKTAAQNVDRVLSGFKSKTTYYFMAHASNASGSASGAILRFTTKRILR
jgi:hypothetical protein